ncbi:LOW QUALITY PROTEIN: F-box/kelch-repeat protein At4g39550 [Eutrema salsugineum]|uniref:LOW QUALITY PROTEIN: F-box/kelch-repeat protein At4g39550 n=1 Tax=Eutrema salsugineum TaxID=72664 RepID=UPI000CED0C66|nr:LOW QUALITY PROTEIN: F-box/kelch-repeat protein At4g39550 [Eutrema salsugineum]
MSSQERKMKKKTKTTNKLSLALESAPSLPDDLLVSCLARVSRLYYPTLSLVSKRFRSLLASPELYKTRSSLGRTESCLYVCLRFHPDPNPRWFTLCLKPDRTLTNDTGKKKKKKSSFGYALAKIPTPDSPTAHWSGLVTIGSEIYNIGGPIHSNERSSSVSILDCTSHTWREAPSMVVKRKCPEANVLDGKIYVAGGCSKDSDFMEVFDPKTQTWELVSSPGTEICGTGKIICKKSLGIDEKVYFFGNFNGLAYKPKEGRWERVGEEMEWDWRWYSYCVIENVIYRYDEGKFKWYDSKARLWRNLKGVKGLPKFARYIARLADYGGKMAVFWDKGVPSSGYKDRVIWCTVIALERRNDEEIWGKVEWLDAMLTVPKSCRVDFALAATV